MPDYDVNKNSDGSYNVKENNGGVELYKWEEKFNKSVRFSIISLFIFAPFLLILVVLGVVLYNGWTGKLGSLTDDERVAAALENIVIWGTVVLIIIVILAFFIVLMKFIKRRKSKR